MAAGVECGAELLVASHRISKFLCLPEPDELVKTPDITQLCVGTIEIDGVDFDWRINSTDDARHQEEAPTREGGKQNAETEFIPPVSF